jgi:hypothetical protein
VLLQGTRILIYIDDGLLSVASNCVPIFLLPYSRTFSCTSKTTGWFTKGKLIPTCYANSVTQGARVLIYIDGLLSVAQTVPKPFAILPSSIFPNVQLLVKRLAGSPRAEIDLTCPANKVLQGSTRILIYIDGLLSIAQTVPKPLLSYLLPYSRTFNCTSKTTGWFTKTEIDPNLPTLTKCYSR